MSIVEWIVAATFRPRIQEDGATMNLDLDDGHREHAGTVTRP